jgi:hypothetical protein
MDHWPFSTITVSWSTEHLPDDAEKYLHQELLQQAQRKSRSARKHVTVQSFLAELGASNLCTRVLKQ